MRQCNREKKDSVFLYVAMVTAEHRRNVIIFMICFKHKWNYGAHVWIMAYDWSVLAMMLIYM